MNDFYCKVKFKPDLGLFRAENRCLIGVGSTLLIFGLAGPLKTIEGGRKIYFLSPLYTYPSEPNFFT